MRRCRYCKEYNIPKDAPKTDAFCCHEHKVAYAMDVVNRSRQKQAKLYVVEAKAERKKFARRKKDYYENDIKTRKAAAVREFNAYIRARDAGEPCISCSKPIPGDDYCAGHYIPAGSNSRLRFDEFNVNGQHNTDCNKHRSGDQVRYRAGLIRKYGLAEVERLENTNGTIKRRPADYKEIEITYRNKRLALIPQAEQMRGAA